MPEFGPSLGRSLIALGVIIILVGLFFIYGGKFGSLGRLPGDIYVDRENFKFYFPLTTSLLVSALISLVLYFFRRRP